jgi:hypothetical protein
MRHLTLFTFGVCFGYKDGSRTCSFIDVVYQVVHKHGAPERSLEVVDGAG